MREIHRMKFRQILVAAAILVMLVLGLTPARADAARGTSQCQ